MKVTKHWNVPPEGEKWSPADEEALREAADVLRNGGTVAFPTETVYGLGADARNTEAVERVFEAKGRPSDNPLIVHIADIAQLEELVLPFGEAAARLMKRFWPGPLTLVLPARPGAVSPRVTAGLDTVAIRMPANETALRLIAAAGCPVAAPSANRSGRPSPTRAAHVADDLEGLIDGIVDGGPAGVGLESTVVELVSIGAVGLPGGESAADGPAAADVVGTTGAGDTSGRAAVMGTDGLPGVSNAEGESAAADAVGPTDDESGRAAVLDAEWLHIVSNAEDESAAAARGSAAAEAGGASPGGVAVRILRPGGITPEALREVVAQVLVDASGETSGGDLPPQGGPAPSGTGPRSPGMKYAHYAPRGEMTLVQGSPAAVQERIRAEAAAARPLGRRTGVLTFDEHRDAYECAADIVITAGSLARPGEAAQELYAALRAFDAAGAELIWAEGCPETGIGLAVMNRLRKAAGGRVIQV